MLSAPLWKFRVLIHNSEYLLQISKQSFLARLNNWYSYTSIVLHNRLDLRAAFMLAVDRETKSLNPSNDEG
jgi:hypothetical protein